MSSVQHGERTLLDHEFQRVGQRIERLNRVCEGLRRVRVSVAVYHKVGHPGYIDDAYFLPLRGSLKEFHFLFEIDFFVLRLLG